MNVALVTLDFGPDRTSGHAIYGELLADGLCAAGHRVTVVASRRNDALSRQTVRGIEVHRAPVGVSDWIAFSYRAARIVERLDRETCFDIVHFLDLHFAYAYRGPFVATLMQTFAQRLRSHGGVPYARSLPNLAFRYAYYHLAGWTLEPRAAHRAKHILASSWAVRDAYVASHPESAAQIDVVPLGIDVNLFQHRDAGALRASLGLEGKRVLLYVGFSTPRKGLEYLGRALDQLGEDCRLVIVGRWEKGYRERFLGSLSARGRSMVIEAGYVPDEEMPVYYSLADAFVLPSLLEGFGLPLVEAMACGTPVVATNVGSIPEVVGDAGILVPAMNSEALAGALRRMLADEGLRRACGERGVLRARTMFSRDVMVDRTLEVYEKYRRR